MIKTLLVDADGVIITGPMFSERYEKIYGVRQADFNSFFLGEFQKCLIGQADLKQEVEKYLPKWNWNKSLDEFLEFWFTSEEEINRDLLQLVTALKKKNIYSYIATNQEKYRSQHLAFNLNLLETFDGMFTSAHIGYTKPDLRYFEKVYEQLNDVEKNEVLFIDDSEKNIEAAKKFGFHAEKYTTFDKFKENLQKYIK